MVILQFKRRIKTLKPLKPCILRDGISSYFLKPDQKYIKYLPGGSNLCVILVPAFKLRAISFQNRTNNVGPNIEPWGTPGRNRKHARNVSLWIPSI